jgi:3-dehydroquinate dehydratase-2
MAEITVIHGPNLNYLGRRETAIYGNDTLADINRQLREVGERLGLTVECIQSNHEGEIIDAIYKAAERSAALIINPGAYTHYSYAIRDALAAVGLRQSRFTSPIFTPGRNSGIIRCSLRPV